MVKIHQGAATATRKPKSIARCWRSCSGSRNNLFQSQKPPTTWCRLWTKLWMHVGCFLKCWNNQGLQGLGLKKWFRSCAALWSAEKQYQGYSNSTCMHVYTFLCVCVRASVPGSQFGGPPPNGMVPPLPPKTFAWYLQHLRVTASHLHAMCSISEPQPSTCTLFAAVESHMLRPTCCPCGNVFSIYMFLFYRVYLYTSHNVSIYYSSVAYDWCISCIIPIHRIYILLIA